ncbi:MAG: Fe-S cluster assembly protein SufD [Gammaproteobacteria bacterium]|nr:MAG: Fe-S cluster assembly protein SufD [Gammaproteobacteria bacterium]TND03459.1 MAG: Fe-S cluster assembly protein SufD [Gammaproteobacteria bacterium]
MTTVAGSSEFYLAQFSAAEGHLPGHDTPWAAAWRRNALNRFRELGFPGHRDEDWKYTSVKALEKQPFDSVLEPSSHLALTDIERLIPAGVECIRIVFVNGHFSRALSDTAAMPAGADVSSLATKLRDEPAAVQSLLENSPTVFRNGFGALNAAFMTDGVFIRLAPRTVLKRPIWLLFISGDQDRAITSQCRNVIVADTDSQATIVEHYSTTGGKATFTNSVTSITVNDNARVTHIKLQQENTTGFHFSEIDVTQNRDSFYHSHSVALGAALARTDIRVTLQAEGAECRLDGLYMGDGRQHVDHHTRVDHVKPHGKSTEYYKGVLNGNARGVFNGKVVVHEQAQKTDSSQTNRNLLLSRNAEIDTKPELEIYADDVKCAHGATIGQLDDDAIFYLRSRGVDEALARNLLTFAFVDDVIRRIEIAPLRKQLEQTILNRLPAGTSLRGLV